MTGHLRLAAESDLPSISKLALDPAARPFLMPGAGELERLRDFWLQGQSAEGPGGLYVVEIRGGRLAGDGLAGALGLSVTSTRSRICELTRLMVNPDIRRRGVGLAALRLACALVLVEHGFHRLQAETYGDNEPGQRLFKAAGFTREGTRRRAYRRRGRWLDGVLYGLLAEEFSEAGAGPPPQASI